MGSHAQAENKPRRRVNKDEGAKHHLITFAVSVVLTVLAFIAVAYEAVPRGFVAPFIVGLAIVQALFQFFIWMHASQKGHNFPIIGIAGGLVVALSAIITFIYFLW